MNQIDIYNIYNTNYCYNDNDITKKYPINVNVPGFISIILSIFASLSAN